jgi:hypothetical protein
MTGIRLQQYHGYGRTIKPPPFILERYFRGNLKTFLMLLGMLHFDQMKQRE